MSRTTVGTFQMLWDCPSCGAVGLLGLDHRHCPTCGSAQDPTSRYYPTDAQKVAVEDHPFHGADLRCAACDTPNSAKATCCVGCGAPLDGAKAVVARSEKGADAADSVGDAKKEVADARAAERERESSRVAERSGASHPGGGTKWALWGGLGCAGLALTAGLGLFFVERFWTTPGTASVTGHGWERTIEIQLLQAVSDSSWRSSVPADARSIVCRSEQSGTKQIADGQDCTTKNVDRGDGTFSAVQDCKPRYRSEPVYDDKCLYTVDRWVTTKNLRTFGAALSPAPTWPIPPEGSATLRAGPRTEAYIVYLTSGAGSPVPCAVAQDRWASMAVGSVWAAELGGLTGDLDCDSLHAP